ncbi:hypothetical protein [Vibrio crassostreae]|uniref:hypothetical protein n=1 Tax=Vibrio crassostreae TaxID=246167 RepID=UPI001B307490|nr:hypothetical protein [Vibrio crassostreae]
MNNFSIKEILPHLPNNEITTKLSALVNAKSVLVVFITTDEDFRIVNFDELTQKSGFIIQKTDDCGYEIYAPLTDTSPLEEASKLLVSFGDTFVIEGRTNMADRIKRYFNEAAIEVIEDHAFYIGGNQIIEGHVTSDLSDVKVRAPLI